MIKREPDKAAKRKHDLIITGGGIYGIMLAFEAAKRGLSPLLLERDDFGGLTSFNSLRIIHGGLRYLQSFDIKRFRESVRERSWFLSNFPDFVRPITCMMPLYGNGLHRNSIFRIALALNDLMSFKRNEGVPLPNQIKNGKIIDPKETKRHFPSVITEGLKGAAVWYDGFMADSSILMIEILHRACTNGAIALNYFEAESLIQAHNRVIGIQATDRVSGERFDFHSGVIVNAAGPFCREIATHFDKDFPNLFRKSIAWNVLFEKKILSDYALALTPKKPKAQTYFLIPWKGKLLAGTGHAGYDKHSKDSLPTKKQLHNFLSDINISAPGLNLKMKDITHIFKGFLPAKKKNTADLAVREVIIDHGSENGPIGLFSVSGVKFTTSRLVAEKVLTKIFNLKTSISMKVDLSVSEFKNCSSLSVNRDFNLRNSADHNKTWGNLKRIIREESVINFEDLIYRRTNLWLEPEILKRYIDKFCKLFSLDGTKSSSEINAILDKIASKPYEEGNLISN